MHQEFKDSYIPAIVTNNIKGNVDTLYNSYNTTKKQLEPHQLNLGQLKGQAKDITLKSSPKPEMLKKNTDIFNQGTNWNPSREPPAYN